MSKLWLGQIRVIKPERTKERKNNMTVEIKGSEMVIKIQMQEPRPSASGKTLVVATTSGNVVTTAQVNGKAVIVGLNAYIKP